MFEQTYTYYKEGSTNECQKENVEGALVCKKKTVERVGR